MPAGKFSWPWQYDFPPFFTIQPNADTKKKQVDAWCELVINFHRHHGRSTLRIADAQSSPLFYNQALNRKLSREGIMEVLSVLHKKGNLEWTDKNKSTCTIVWKTPEQLADLIYSYIFEKAMVNTVCTIFEIQKGEETSGQEFHGIEDEVFMKALRILEKRRKAEVIGDEGVKFFM